MLPFGLCASKRGRALQVQAMASDVPDGSRAANAKYGVSPDVIDSTAKGLELALGQGAKVLEDTLLNAMTGKALHRLSECRTVLHT